MGAETEPEPGGTHPYRRFGRITDPDQRQGLINRLEEHGVTRARAEAETDLGGLFAEVNIRGVQRMSLREAADAADLSVEDARRVWLTTGIAVGGDDDPAFNDQDVSVLRFYAAGRDLFGDEPVLQTLRVIGSAMARIAEAETGALRLAYEIPSLEAGDSEIEVQEGYGHISRMLLPAVEHVFPPLHRLHLTRSARRAWAVDDASGATMARVAVGFADLAGFTSLSGELSPSELAAVVDVFDAHVSELVLTNGGQVVKLIGDEVMFAADDPQDGLRIVRSLAAGLPGAGQLPAVRIGAAHGEVLNRDGDYYGSVVNLAARLVSLAEPGEVLVDASLAGAAGPDAVEALPETEVKGFTEPVRPFRLRG